MKIAILGAGAFGTALGGILADNGYDIDYYDKKLEPERLSDVLTNAKIIVLCVPSVAVPYLLPYLPKQIPMIIATKGMLDDKPFKKFKDIMVLSGPGFAEDIKAGKETFLTATDERIKRIFQADFLKFDYTDDEKGVLMCGSLKNVYAILAGLLNLKKGTSKWRDFIDVVSREMKDILKANGANPKTVDLACGIGDLELTCDIPSRNYQYGQILRDNHNAVPDKTVEGLTALNKIKRGEIKIPDSTIKLYELMEKI